PARVEVRRADSVWQRPLPSTSPNAYQASGRFPSSTRFQSATGAIQEVACGTCSCATSSTLSEAPGRQGPLRHAGRRTRARLTISHDGSTEVTAYRRGDTKSIVTKP